MAPARKTSPDFVWALNRLNVPVTFRCNSTSHWHSRSEVLHTLLSRKTRNQAEDSQGMKKSSETLSGVCAGTSGFTSVLW
jgi:hypothetical protein